MTRIGHSRIDISCVITYTRPNFSDYLDKPYLKLEGGIMGTSNQGMRLFIHILNPSHNMLVKEAMEVSSQILFKYEECCARSRYQGQGHVIVSHNICGMYLFVPALDTCFWYNSPHM